MPAAAQVICFELLGARFWLMFKNKFAWRFFRIEIESRVTHAMARLPLNSFQDVNFETWTLSHVQFFLLQIRDACKDLILDDKTLREIMSKFLGEVEKGLQKKTHPQADIKCFVTYVQDLPNGKGKEVIDSITQLKLTQCLLF